MGDATSIGRRLLAVCVIVFGIQGLAYTEFVPGLEPGLTRWLAHVPWAWVNGALPALAGLGLLWDRTARGAAWVLAGLLLLWVVALHGPGLIANVANQADDALHVLGIAAAALVLAAGVSAPASARWLQAIRLGGVAGRLIFGGCLIGYGMMHFVFFQFTADFIPGWIPWHRFWAGFTGAAQIAAGLAVLSGVLARLASLLAALMYASWVVLIHAPRVLAAPKSHGEWTDLFTCAALCAASLLVAGAVAKTRVPIAAATAPQAA